MFFFLFLKSPFFLYNLGIFAFLLVIVIFSYHFLIEVKNKKIKELSITKTIQSKLANLSTQVIGKKSTLPKFRHYRVYKLNRRKEYLIKR